MMEMVGTAASFANESFYLAGATVIPVLFLAVALQENTVVKVLAFAIETFGKVFTDELARAPKAMRKEEAQRKEGVKPKRFTKDDVRAGNRIGLMTVLVLWATFGLALGLVGEIFALRALYLAAGSPADAALTWLGLMMMLSIVLLGFALSAVQTVRDTTAEAVKTGVIRLGKSTAMEGARNTALAFGRTMKRAFSTEKDTPTTDTEHR